MIGGSSSGGQQGIDISKYLVNFNAADWANTANNYLTSALNQGIAQSEKYNNAAIGASNAATGQANQALTQGYDMAQALNSPQRLATYQALDAYQDSLGLARPNVGSFQLASALENQARGDQNIPGQQYIANAFNQGLLGPTQGVQ
jgi:hypothetical protein